MKEIITNINLLPSLLPQSSACSYKTLEGGHGNSTESAANNFTPPWVEASLCLHSYLVLCFQRGKVSASKKRQSCSLLWAKAVHLSLTSSASAILPRTCRKLEVFLTARNRDNTEKSCLALFSMSVLLTADKSASAQLDLSSLELICFISAVCCP